MGKMEEENRKERWNKNIQKAILGTVAVAGVLAVAALAPNALQALGMLGRGKRAKERVSNSRKRLVQNGLLEYSERGLLKLTPKGEAKLRQLELHDFKLKKPNRWDKKWRLLIFDIREERKPTREKVRRTLVCIGFLHLQDSAWIYPYDCEDLITLLKSDFKIGRELLYIIADKIENDGWLKKYFGLV